MEMEGGIRLTGLGIRPIKRTHSGFLIRTLRIGVVRGHVLIEILWHNVLMPISFSVLGLFFIFLQNDL
jgi:hypothetical protein